MQTHWTISRTPEKSRGFLLGGKVIPTSYHANFVQLLPRPLMPDSTVFYGKELLEQAPTP